MRKNYSFIKLASVFTCIGLLTSCSALNPPVEVTPFEGKASVVGLDHIVNDSKKSFLDNFKGDVPPEEWEVEFLLDRTQDKVITVSVDEKSFEGLEVGQTFCFSNVEPIIKLDQIHGDDECEF